MATEEERLSHLPPKGESPRHDHHDDDDDDDGIFVTGKNLEEVAKSTKHELTDAIDEGDMLKIDDLLQKLSDDGCDMDIRDDDGLNTYAHAISGGFAPVVSTLLKYGVPLGDAMLRACSASFEDAAKMLCKYAKKLPEKERKAILDCHCDNDDFHHALTPLKMAAIRNNFVIVQALLGAGATRIAEPKLQQLAEASLTVVIEYLDIYRALSSEAYLGLAYPNALANAFRLTGRLRRIGDGWEAVNKEFYRLADQVEDFAASLLNYVNSSYELCILCEQSDNPEISHPVALMQTAVDFDQKAFVAHAYSVNIMTNNLYQTLSALSPSMMVFVTVLSILGYPFLSLAYIIWQHEKLENFIKIPYIKLCMNFGSDLAFMIITAMICFFTDVDIVETFAIVMVIFCIALSWKHINDILRFGKSDFFGYGMNLLEMSIIILTFALITCHVVDRLQNTYVLRATNRHNQRIAEIMNRSSLTMNLGLNGTEQGLFEITSGWNDPYVIIRSLFAIIIILNVMRAFQTVLKSYHDIFFIWKSTAGAVHDIVTFLIVYVVISVGFVAGLTGLYNVQLRLDLAECGDNTNCGIADASYSTIPRTTLTLWWVLNGIADSPTLAGRVTVVNALYVAVVALYLVVALVLINTLIAMLSSRFAALEENSDEEWKFDRTKMWLRFIRTDVSISPPFNLLPTSGYLWGIVKSCLCCTQTVDPKTKDKENDDKTKGNPRALMKTILNRYNTANIEKVDEEDSITLDDLRGLKQDFLTVKFNIQTKLRITKDMIDEIWKICRSINMQVPTLDEVNERVPETKDGARGIFLEEYPVLDDDMDDIRAAIKEVEKAISYRPEVPPKPSSSPHCDEPEPKPVEPEPKSVTPEKVQTLRRDPSGSSLTRKMAGMFEGGKTILEDEEVSHELSRYRESFGN